MHRAVGMRRRLQGPLRPTWSHEFETVATALRLWGKQSTRLPLAIQRGALIARFEATAAVRETISEKIAACGPPAEWLRRADSDHGAVLLYLHGGGYSIGSIDSHRDLLCRLCAASGASVMAVDYRLAPEHPFPAQLEDAMAAYRWLLDRGHDPARIVIGGESAGGGLTLSTLISARDAGLPLPAAAFVLSPWVDLESRGMTFATNERYDFVHRRTLDVYARRFVGRGDRRNPLAAPIHADLAGLPPLLIHAGGAESLLDDALHLARRARAAGVHVDLDVWPDMIHAWHIFGFLDEAREAVGRIGDFVRAATRPGSRFSSRAV